MKITEITLRIIVPTDDYVYGAVTEMIQDEHQDWLVETVSEDDREATDEEREAFGA